MSKAQYKCFVNWRIYLWWASSESLFHYVAECLPVEASADSRHVYSPTAAAEPTVWRVQCLEAASHSNLMPYPEAAATSQTQRWENQEGGKEAQGLGV